MGDPVKRDFFHPLPIILRMMRAAERNGYNGFDSETADLNAEGEPGCVRNIKK